MLPQGRGFHLSQQYLRNHVVFSTDWRKHPRIRRIRSEIRNKIAAIFPSGIHHEQVQQTSDLPTILEDWLFNDAASQEEYINEQTLMQRLQTQVEKLFGTKYSQPQLLRSIISTLSMYAIKDVDLEATQKNESAAFLTTISKCPQSEYLNSLAQNVSREVPKVSNLFSSMSSRIEYSSLGDLRQDQDQNLDFQQNFNHFMQPHELNDKASMAKSTSCFVYQGQHCSRLCGKKTLKRPQYPTRLLNMDEQFTSESLVGRSFLGASPVLNSDDATNFKASVEQRILSAYFHYKNLNNFAGEDLISVKDYLHSAVCGNGMCTCDQSINIVLHLNNCQRDYCQICWNWKSVCFTGAPEPHSEFTNTKIIDSTQNNVDGPSGIFETGLPPAKRKKVEPSEKLSEMQLQAESPFTSIYYEVAECNVEQFTNPVLDSVSISKIKNSVNEEKFGQTFKSENIHSERFEADLISLESQPKVFIISSNFKECVISEFKNSAVADTVGQTFMNENIRSEGLEAGHTLEDSKPKDHEVAVSSNLKETVISELKNSATDHTFGQIFECENIPSEGLEAAHISEESKSKDHEFAAISNLKENVINEKKNSATDDTRDQIFECENISSEGLENAHISEESKPKHHEFAAISNVKENGSSEKKNSATDYTLGQIFECENISSEGLEAGHISVESKPKGQDATASSNLHIKVKKLNSRMQTLCKDPIVADIEDIHGRTGFHQVGKNVVNNVTEPQAEQENEKSSSKTVVNSVSLTEFFSSDLIKEHIMSLRKQFDQISTDEERGTAANTCQLCEMQNLSFAPVPIYCLCCGFRIKRNKYYYVKSAEEVVSQHYFCTVCYRNSRGGSITFNGISVSKEVLEKRKNDVVFEEPWVLCDKCKRWQHQICALYNNKRDLDSSAEYICPTCRLEDIENGVHVPLPKTAIFCAKDLPRTLLSDQIEKRLFKRLMQEKADLAKKEGNKTLNMEVLTAEDLSVRVVLSIDKQLEVKKQFLDIFPEENYPGKFPYRSQVILLFQKLEGVDVCIFGMYVQEFGSECGYPNQNCVYISYLDSVKYFRPDREAVTGEALRTFVYHEILIGYLDFCKKRGFTTCYIWACPPLKGEDYLLYCHPDTQKTPKNDKLRRWYHSMLRKASEENIVVGLTNIYDHFFAPTRKCDSNVTAARLPYFDGDFWSGTAMDLARKIEQENAGEYEKILKEHVSKRTLKAMGYVNPSKGTAKDILVMMKLGQTILPFKEDFIVAHLQYECIHCNKVIVSGKRSFCAECKNFQECERCHTANSHTSITGEKHTLCQVVMDDAPFDTNENEIILDNRLFENRHNFLSFCQKNQFQFDTLRRAKYSSMMILYHLRSSTSKTPCQPGNKKFREDSVLIQKLLHVLRHASQCRSTKTPPCTYPNCTDIKKLFHHAKICTVRAAGGCEPCKKAWLALTAHSRSCRDSPCFIPRCMDLKKYAEWIAMQSDSRRRAAVVERIGAQ